MFRRVLLTTLTLAAIALPAQGQWSSDIPGVPRASIPLRGAKQARTEWHFSGYKLPDDTLAAGLALGVGRSYRVATRFEVGFDFTLIDGLFVKGPEDVTTTGDEVSGTYLRGLAVHGIRIGGKFRPFSALDPDGYGWEAAVGAAVQPGLRPLFGVERFADSTRTGGQFTSDDEDLPLRGAEPFAALHTSTLLSAMVSYRAQRIMFDAALVVEKGTEDEDEDDGAAGAADWPTPVAVYDGVSVNVGATYRLRPGLAVGGAYWGKGAPPWRSEIVAGRPGELKEEQFGVLVQFGSQAEAGTDLMVSSPTGKFGESLRIMIRTRSTR